VRLYVIGDLPARHAERLAGRFPDVAVITAATWDRREGVDAVLMWEQMDPAPLVPVLRAHPALPWVHTNLAGVPAALLEALDGHPAALTNGSGAHAPSIAEFVAAALLMFAKRLPELRAFQERGEWASGMRVGELGGRTVGIVGLGDVGLAIARVLRPFGVRLLGVRRRPEPVAEIDALYPRSELPEFLARLDALVLAAPLTAETAGLIGTSELARLPRGACVVNVARGALLDEAGLIAALRSGHLGGAALDVFAEEPLPATSPLWRLPNVIVSPHCCDNTPQTADRGLEIFLDNLGRFRGGAPLRNVVDRDLGY